MMLGAIGPESIHATTVVSFVSANVNESVAWPPDGPAYVNVMVALPFVPIITSLT